MSAYYNEIDPSAAAWLRQLIADGHIADGIVDERSIEDVSPDELVGFTQCHFFAGIGGWSYALRLAGWPDDKPVWTGSCPCQPYSSAGAGKGDNDPRALWWAFRWHIQQRQPAVVFGEQVASLAGREWFAGVRADLEAMGYDVGGADLCAAGVGAPHIRQRLYWVGHSQRPGLEGLHRDGDLCHQPGREHKEAGGSTPASGGTNFKSQGAWESTLVADCGEGKRRRISTEPAFFPLANGIPARVVRIRGYGNAIVPEVAAEFIQAYGDCHA